MVEPVKSFDDTLVVHVKESIFLSDFFPCLNVAPCREGKDFTSGSFRVDEEKVKITLTSFPGTGGWCLVRTGWKVKNGALSEMVH